MIYEGVGEVDVADMLEDLGLDNVRRIGRGEVEYSCAFQDGHSFGDQHPSAHMNEDKLVWRCKGCGRAGTALEIISVVKHISAIQALRWLRERYGEVYQAPRGGSIAAEMRMIEEKRREIQVEHRYPDLYDTVLEKGIFYVDWDQPSAAQAYMQQRGFEPATLRESQIGYDGWTQRITIPVRSENGRLIGFKGRTIDPRQRTRYLLLGDTPDRAPRYGFGYGFDMHDPTTVIFGLDQARVATSLREYKQLVVLEGELDVIALRQQGIYNGVAIGTTTITAEQQRLLRWHADELVLFYDSDSAGQGAIWGYEDNKQRWYPGILEKLSPYLRIKIVPEHEGDPASMPTGQARELIESAESWMTLASA